jgi:hypothetical protein
MAHMAVEQTDSSVSSFKVPNSFDQLMKALCNTF